ncbi:MAG TPA: hypothetical protein VFV79_08445 [Saprospiraceae bacterium]|nr:hypothetical protein [Saprospiraceae bacterium]
MMDDYYIEGESLWRMQSYGVSNHYFDIGTYLILDHMNYPTSPVPITGTCGYEYYSSDYCQLYDDEDEAVNTLIIQPYTDCDRNDYLNGVSTLDLYKIYHHIHGPLPFEDMDPEEDAPFRYISADADADEDVDDADVYMIQQMILGYRDDLTRTSWEWVLKDALEGDPERFEDYPFEFVLSDQWPGGIIIPALKTEDITVNLDKYFGFRTTKEGDIIGIGEEEVTTNDWICGSGYYFNGGSIASRSNLFSTMRAKIENGSIINFDVYIDNPKELLTFELPIFFNTENLELNSINFITGFVPKWNFRSSLNLLTLLDFSRDNKPLNVPGGKLFSFSMITNSDINKPEELINSNAYRKIETIGMDEKSADIGLRIEISNVIPRKLRVEGRIDGSQLSIFIASPESQKVNVRLFSSDGTVLNTRTLILSKGDNLFPIDISLPPGILFIAISNGSEVTISKIAIPQ